MGEFSPFPRENIVVYYIIIKTFKIKWNMLFSSTQEEDSHQL